MTKSIESLNGSDDMFPSSNNIYPSLADTGFKLHYIFLHQ